MEAVGREFEVPVMRVATQEAADHMTLQEVRGA